MLTLRFWMFLTDAMNRCLAAFETYDELGRQFDDRNSISPVGQIGQLTITQSKSRSIESFMVLRPSELHFIVQLLDPSNLASSLFSTSRTISEALTTLNSSDLLNRLAKNSLTIATSAASKFRFYRSNSLDRETTLVLSTVNMGAKDWMELLNKRSDGGTEHSMFSAEEADSLFLSSVVEPEMVSCDEEMPAIHELSSIQWLVNAARSMLTRVYEDGNLFSKGDAIRRELLQLRDSIESKKQLIHACLYDWKKLLQCKELLANYHAQISLLLDLIKTRKKNGSDNIRMQSFAFGTLRLPVLSALFRIPANFGEPIGRPITWIPQDEEKESAIIRLFQNQNVLEKQLQTTVQSSANTSKMLSVSTANAWAATVSAKATTQLGTPLRISSLHLEECSMEATDILPPMMSPSTGGMNPLWTLMQSVFANNSSTVTPQSSATIPNTMSKSSVSWSTPAKAK
jgi:hypothetical protein